MLIDLPDPVTASREEFEVFNLMRGRLIEKQFSGFTREESARPFHSFPGWEEEVARRKKANLTPLEKTTLDILQQWTSSWVDAHFPRPTLIPIESP